MPKMEVLPTELFKLITSSISFVDAMTLRWCCRSLYAMPMPAFAARFKTKLFSLFNLDPALALLDVYPTLEAYEHSKQAVHVELTARWPKYVKKKETVLVEQMKLLRYGLIHELSNCDAIVAGSFVLNILYDAAGWESSDIDVYDAADMSSCHGDRSYFTYGSQYLRFAQFLWCCGFRGKSDYRKVYNQMEETCKRVLDYRPLEVRDSHKILAVQVIPVPMDIKKFISGSFDLDICKSSFDGKQLQVRSWSKLIYRRDYIKYTHSFVMEYYETVCNAEYGQYEPIADRAVKYRNRGFDIKQHPQMQEIDKHVRAAIATGRHTTVYGYQEKIKFVADGSIDLDLFYQE